MRHERCPVSGISRGPNMVNAIPIFAGTHQSLSPPGKERKEEGGAP
jgi:hypothetical protein